MILPSPKKFGKKQSSNLIAMIFGLIFILGVVSIITPNPVEKSDSEETIVAGDAGPTRNVNYTAYYFRVIVMMVVSIVHFCIVSIRLYQRYLRVNDKSNLELKILGRKYINSKQYLLKVFVDNRLLLLGISEQSVNLIADLSEKLESDEGAAEETPPAKDTGKHLDIRDQKD